MSETNSQRPWCDYEIDTVIDMYLSRCNTEEIGRIINRSPITVYQLIKQLIMDGVLNHE